MKIGLKAEEYFRHVMTLNNIFFRILLNKKYALPYRVVDAVVFHFLGFR